MRPQPVDVRDIERRISYASSWVSLYDDVLDLLAEVNRLQAQLEQARAWSVAWKRAAKLRREQLPGSLDMAWQASRGVALEACAHYLEGNALFIKEHDPDDMGLVWMLQEMAQTIRDDEMGPGFIAPPAMPDGPQEGS